MMVTTSLHRTPVPISTALADYAGQDGCDGDPYDLMQTAAQYIRALESAMRAQSYDSGPEHPMPGHGL